MYRYSNYIREGNQCKPHSYFLTVHQFYERIVLKLEGGQTMVRGKNKKSRRKKKRIRKEDINKKNTRKSKKKVKKKRFKKFILIFIFITFLLVNKDFVERFSWGKSKKSLQVIQKYPTEPEEKIRFYDDRLIKWNGRRIIALNKDGTSLWEKEINFDKPLVFFGLDRIYICEEEMGDLYFLSLDGRSEDRIQVEKTIKDIVEEGELIFLTIEDEEGKSVTVMDKEGVVEDNIPFEDERLVEVNVNKDRSNIALATIDTKEGYLDSRLIFHKEKGKHNSDLNFKDEIIISVHSVDKNSIIVFTDNRLYFIEKEKILWKRELDNIKDMYVDRKGKKIYVLESNTLDTISYKNKLEKSISLEKGYEKIEGFNKGLLLLGENQVIGIDKGKKNLEYKSKEKLEGMIVEGSDIILITPDRINIMTIKK